MVLLLLLAWTGHAETQLERSAVADCHADPTGVTDSTDALARCHASGDRVYYPNGVYRFNGPSLDLSGGVRFESPERVVVRNNISSENVLQLDDVGRLIGLQQNHLEVSDLTTAAPMTVGSLVPPPLSSATTTPRRAQVLGFWYNDGGLETRRANPGSGWLGWYYWTWAFHGGYPFGNMSLPARYDPARKPLLGFYRGDDVTVLEWQCLWLREYGVTGVILIGGGVEPRGDPASAAFWQWQLFHRVANFRQLGYVMTMADGSSTRGGNASVISSAWETMLTETYDRFPSGSFKVKLQNGTREYPLVYLFEEASMRGSFDSWNGCKNTVAFYCKMAARFQARGFAGMAVLGRHPFAPAGGWAPLEDSCGLLHFDGGYGDDYSTDDLRNTSETYADHVANYTPPTGPGRVIASTTTSKYSHYPHPSAWRLRGSTPFLFEQELEKAVCAAEKHASEDMQTEPVVTVYNIGEWAEGGPGLQPNQKDRFGYLQAVKNVTMGVPCRKGLR